MDSAGHRAAEDRQWQGVAGHGPEQRRCRHRQAGPRLQQVSPVGRRLPPPTRGATDGRRPAPGPPSLNH
ncbi:hypothetical protein SGPA1_31065 [Streptomyces misionensis JCM 4497]